MEDLFVFAIAIFSFVFIVTSPGNAFLYGGPIRFCHHHFSFYFCCDFSSKCTFVWRASPFSSSLFFVLFSLWQLLENALLSVFVIAIFCFLFVVATPENALSYGESLSFPYSCFLWLLHAGNALLYRGPSCFLSTVFFLWLLLEMHFWMEDLSVFVISIFVLCFFFCKSTWKCIFLWRTLCFCYRYFLFCFVFDVTSPGNALLYEEPLHFPQNSFFCFASARMHFCIEDTSLFPSSLFFCFAFSWLLLKMFFCIEGLSIYLITVFFLLLILLKMHFGTEDISGFLKAVFVFCFWYEFS